MADFDLRDDAIAPVTLRVCDTTSGPVTGLTPVYQVFDVGLGQFLDFGDLLFKAAPALASAPLAEVGNGLYTRSPGLDLASLTNKSGLTLIFYFSAVTTGGLNVCAQDTISFDTFNQLKLQERLSCNATEIDYANQTFVLFDDDGVTPLKTWPLETNGGEAVTPQPGIPSKRRNSI